MTQAELGNELSDIQSVSGINYQRHHSFFFTEPNTSMYVRYAPISRSLAGPNLEIYHYKAQLGGRREGLLVYPGAHSNLSGDQWVQRVTALAPIPIKYKNLEKAQGVEGVGSGVQQCLYEATVPLALPFGHRASYRCPVIENSGVPGLLGLHSLRENRCTTDCYNGALYQVAEGDYQLTLPEGSRRYPLDSALSGHWMLPVTEWEMPEADPLV